MFPTHQIELEKLGLSTPEAQIYLALLDNGGPQGASALTARTAISRSNVYLTLTALADRGLIEEEAGYSRRFSAIPPDRALPALVARKNDELLQCQRIAGDLVKQLQSAAKPAGNNGESEQIQVLRDPRVIAERFDRLQLEAERQIEVFTKAPFFVRPGNPAEEKAQKRGVRVRSLYERAILNDTAVEPYLMKWIAAGEEARVYDGELPHKLAIFDKQVVLMPLILSGDQTRALLIRHAPLAESLSFAFEFLWQQAEPIARPSRKRRASVAKPEGQKPKKPFGVKSTR